MIVAIHQPEYFPVLSVLDKMRRADVFVILDHVDFNREALQHRAKILTLHGPKWLTIPVAHPTHRPINQLRVADPCWTSHHRRALRTAYGRTPYSDDVIDMFSEVWNARHELLAETTRPLFRQFYTMLSLNGRIFSSAMMSGLEKTLKGELVLEICRRVGATAYLSGRGGSAYLDREHFAAADIAIHVQDFVETPYPQRFGAAFVPGLSCLDFLLNHGFRALVGALAFRSRG